MAKRKYYASYDPRIKAAIASTGRVDLFPELKIPRTTALHWIKQGYVIDDPILEMLTTAINGAREKSDNMHTALEESRAMTKLVKEVFEILGFSLRWKHIDSVDVRDSILKAVSTAMESARRNMCLETLDLSLSRYKRWKREKRGCGLPNTKVCPKKGNSNSLTFREIQLMGDFVTSAEYAHFPIRSLHYYAKRKGLLYCTYSTWRKYIDLYRWLRPRKKRRKKYERVGIRAKRPNEIWHMDVSHFILPDGSKCFIQAIIDNFSRYVLAWQILTSYDGAKTGALLEMALKRSLGMKPGRRYLRLLVDGGGENKSDAVNKLEAKGHFKKQVAQFEISYSNSIVEALFRQLKHNYLYSQDIKNHKALTKHANFWFTDHNERIPHTAFSGETPLERFKQSWSKAEEIRIVICHEDAIKLRIEHNQKVFCQMCEAA